MTGSGGSGGSNTVGSTGELDLMDYVHLNPAQLTEFRGGRRTAAVRNTVSAARTRAYVPDASSSTSWAARVSSHLPRMCPQCRCLPLDACSTCSNVDTCLPGRLFRLLDHEIQWCLVILELNTLNVASKHETNHSKKVV